MEMDKADFDMSSQTFALIVEHNTFIDKTGLIIAFFKHKHRVLLITAPRRYGKSTNMNMLGTFAEIQVNQNGDPIALAGSRNYRIFAENNLFVYQHPDFFEQHFGVYPVINFSFKNVYGTTKALFLSSCKRALYYTFNEHSYLTQSNHLKKDQKELISIYQDIKKCKDLDETDVTDGIKFLSQCLHSHYKRKVILLIDEYDAPMNAIMFEGLDEYSDIEKVFRLMLSNSLKGNDENLERALITGISRFASVEWSGLNNVKEKGFLGKHEFVPFYGLMESEVNTLLKKFHLESRKEEIEKYYNGYTSLNEEKLYSIWSILNFVELKVITGYWCTSGVAVRLKNALRLPSVRYFIDKFLQGEPLPIKIPEVIDSEYFIQLEKLCNNVEKSEKCVLLDPSAYLTFLLQQGYLSYAEKQDNNHGYYLIKIPNEEVRSVLKSALEESYGGSSTYSLLSDCGATLTQISPSWKKENYVEFLSKSRKYFSREGENAIVKNEDFFHILMFNILSRSNFKLATEFRIDGGRADLIACIGEMAICIEMKYNKTAKAALEQILLKYVDFVRFIPFSKFQPKWTIFIGINVNEDYEISCGVLVNSTILKEASYYFFK